MSGTGIGREIQRIASNKPAQLLSSSPVAPHAGDDDGRRRSIRGGRDLARDDSASYSGLLAAAAAATANRPRLMRLSAPMQRKSSVLGLREAWRSIWSVVLAPPPPLPALSLRRRLTRNSCFTLATSLRLLLLLLLLRSPPLLCVDDDVHDRNERNERVLVDVAPVLDESNESGRSPAAAAAEGVRRCSICAAAAGYGWWGWDGAVVRRRAIV